MTRPTLPAVGALNWGQPLIDGINAVSDKADSTASTVATLQSTVAAIPAVNTSITIAGDGTPTLAVAGGGSASTLKLGNSGTDPGGAWVNQVVGTWFTRSNWTNLARAQWLAATTDYTTFTAAHPDRAADIGVPVVPHDSGTALDTLFDMVVNNTPIPTESVTDVDGNVITTPNQVFTSMGKSLARLGIATNYLRWFWEMNQNVYSFTASKYVAAVQHAIPLVNAAFTAECTRLGYTKVIKHVFSPISDGKDFTQFYFGDAYVDIIAPDVYGTIWGTTTPSAATLTATVQGYLNTYATFATAHSKQVGLGEWGNFALFTDGVTGSHGRGDEPAYIDTIINWLKAQNAVYAVYFNINGGGSGQTLANTPNSLAELIVAQQSLAGSTSSFRLARTDRYLPLPAGTPTVGQIPVVTTVSPLALGYGSGGGAGTLVSAKLSGLTSGGSSVTTSVATTGTALPLAKVVTNNSLDTTAHANAVTITTGQAGDYLVIAKAKVSSTAAAVSLANLTNGRTPTGGGVTATGGRARFSVGSAGGYAGADHVGRTFGPSPLSVANFDVTMDFYMSGEVYPSLWARADVLNLSANNGYQLAFNDSGTQMLLRKIVGGTATTLGTFAFSIPTTTLCKIRFSGVGTAIKAWIETGTAAFGGAPNISVTDSGVTAPGYVGLDVGGGGAANSGYLEIDNLLVTDGAGSPTTLVTDNFDGTAPAVDQKVLSVTVNGTVTDSNTEYAAAPRLVDVCYLTLAVGDYVGLQASGASVYSAEALTTNDVTLTLVKQ